MCGAQRLPTFGDFRTSFSVELMTDIFRDHFKFSVWPETGWKPAFLLLGRGYS